VTPETRAAAIDALTYRHDQLLESLYRERHGRFDRTDPACTSARRWLAHELLAIRRARADRGVVSGGSLMAHQKPALRKLTFRDPARQRGELCQCAVLTGFECNEAPTHLVTYDDHERRVCTRHARTAPTTSYFVLSVQPLESVE
jgi:hypothetical protein